MHTPLRTPRRRLLLLVAAVLGSLVAAVGTGTVAQAETVVPQLTALTVTPTSVTPPGEVEIHYTATAGTSTLGYVRAYFTSPAGSRGAVILDKIDAPLDGVIRWAVPDGLRNATYALTSVTVMSTDGTAGTVYKRDGTTSRGGAHDLDFPGKDVTVGGSHEDFDGPALVSVDVQPTAVKPGQPVTITWAANEPHGWKSAWFSFAGVDRPSSMELTTSSAAELSAGTMTRTVPASLYNVKHTLAQAILVDGLGNKTSYLADGSLSNTPYDSPSVQTSHTLPFASWGFSVSGSTYDARPPQLDSISLDKTTIRTYDRVKVSYATQDDSSPLEQLYLKYSRPGYAWEIGLFGTQLPVVGSFTDSLGDGGYPGQLTLEGVQVMDARGNACEYWPDGTIRDLDGRITGRHTLDLSALDVKVLPRKVDLGVRSRPQSLLVAWGLGPEEDRGVTGYQLTVNPGGRVITVPKSGSTIVTGLTNATRYTVTVKALSDVGSSPVTSATATPLISGNVWSAGDVNADGRNDLFAALPGGYERLYRGRGGATFSGGTYVSNYGPGYRFFPGGKPYGYASFLAVSSWDDGLEGVMVDRDGRFNGGLIMGKGWGHRFLDGSADFTGDGRADLVGVTEGGTAYLYRATSTDGKYTYGTRIATGWGSMQKVFAATDVTGDKRADLLGVDKDGVLWIFPGTGRGTFSPKRKVSSGWGGLGGLFYARDLNGDGKGDLGAVTMDGTLRVYKGWGNGTFSSAVTVGKGWAPYL